MHVLTHNALHTEDVKRAIDEFTKYTAMMEEEPLIELTGVQVQETSARTLSHEDTSFLCLFSERDVQTTYGSIHVSIQGKEGKPAMVTLHDVGQNHTSAFLSFFNFVEVQPLLEHFCIYHIDAPGQEDPKMDLPENYVYPTMDEMASLVVGEVVEQMSIKSFIGIGIGAGANALCRYALLYPNQVDALMLINLVTSKSGWIEWGYEKVCVRQLQSKGLTTFVEDFLLWHHFGDKTKIENMDLALAYKESLRSLLNPRNLGLFLDSYIKRTTIELARPDILSKEKKSLKCPTLLLTGTSAPHRNEVAEAYGHMDPSISEYIKISDCGGMPLEEQPHKVATAMILFLQGQGFVQKLRTSSTLSIGKLRSDSSSSGMTASSTASLPKEPQAC